jgi:hypothetical protein
MFLSLLGPRPVESSTVQTRLKNVEFVSFSSVSFLPICCVGKTATMVRRKVSFTASGISFILAYVMMLF